MWVQLRGNGKISSGIYMLMLIHTNDKKYGMSKWLKMDYYLETFCFQLFDINYGMLGVPGMDPPMCDNRGNLLLYLFYLNFFYAGWHLICLPK